MTNIYRNCKCNYVHNDMPRSIKQNPAVVFNENAKESFTRKENFPQSLKYFFFIKTRYSHIFFYYSIPWNIFLFLLQRFSSLISNPSRFFIFYPFLP